MAELYEKAKEVRKTIMDQVLSEGTAPTVAEISRKHSLSAEEINGIFKAYCTRVGNGPFPSELLAEDAV